MNLNHGLEGELNVSSNSILQPFNVLCFNFAFFIFFLSFPHFQIPPTMLCLLAEIYFALINLRSKMIKLDTFGNKTVPYSIKMMCCSKALHCMSTFFVSSLHDCKWLLFMLKRIFRFMKYYFTIIFCLFLMVKKLYSLISY